MNTTVLIFTHLLAFIGGMSVPFVLLAYLDHRENEG